MEIDGRNIYIQSDVRQVRELHTGILEKFNPGDSILDLLDQMAVNLHESNLKGDPRSQIEIFNFLKTDEYSEVNGQFSINLNMARLAMARQHGYADWEEVKYVGRIPLQPVFETAVDLLVKGDLLALKELLENNSHLLIQRSSFNHRAALIHYVSSNGVEIRRQMVPENLPDMVRLLISLGAERDALGYFYGEMMDTASLLRTSSHAHAAGVFDEVITLLL